ncbi:NirD/YgiW/YdeI family stress tolerance protein [Mastigocoleus sp. MO_188.B34]|uniref:NirD/YgiW/YdeI family stress tolerance protein n=1 Tax=Mastigocoleus sp. MO_188.B34 TaxID=3036635 RepID=UPI00261A4392|nr:NirD/YgiW/YdeI family stress tolerance protein [Mastigocoleus sp. MO_188.B34]MDJ0696853.1 NirD/YgiW/YdeI family stress tolerance protein [Mastigocoleus sp. MO_188.B34]
MKFFVTISAISLATVSSFLVSLSALAQAELTSVSKVLASPKDDMEVKLRGKILSQQEGEAEYVFTDNGKDKIILDIPEEKNFKYDPEKTIEVSGVVNIKSDEEDKEKEDSVDPTPELLEIEVKEIKVISDAD